MFGITPLGWVHTLGSLPAIPAAAYMFAVHGRIVPRSTAGIVYLISMLIGAATVFFVTHMPAGHVIGALTLLLLGIGYTIGRTPLPARAVAYVETIVLSVTAFLLMLPTATEILRRVPDGHPFVTDLKSPLLLGVQAGILAALVIGIGAQIVYLRRTGGAASA
ncbi:hypothetical protein FHT98_0808 [Bosea sp. AK1]|uniref:hypothetical protein n=1 Tax=Bosea sp. AK1 TaxID=2587160 RepID=UPI001153172F|nr:hypothetical protein [Bosea sp. AK1]TQI73083.1 hypothetical protein FHT98_0808 [Bosea sp. AK1]